MLKISRYYEDIESLNKLDVTHILRCQKYVKYYALQNVYKIYYTIDGCNVKNNCIICKDKIYKFFKYMFFFLFLLSL